MKKDIKAKELHREISFLYRVAQSVHSLEIDELLTEIVKIAIEVTKGDSCLIYILDPKKQVLILRASKTPHPKLLSKITMKMGEGITGWVAKEKKSVVLDRSAYKDPRFKFFSSLPEDRFEAFLSVAILNKHGVCGVINVQYKKAHKHKVMELNLLTAIGKMVGGAVENALLIEEMLALKETLTLRKLIDRARGILMKKQNLSEDEAFRLIQKESMDTRKTIKEIAEALILADRINFGS